MTEEITVVYCEPEQLSCVRVLKSDLVDLQAAVDGSLEVIYPFKEQVCIVCNDESKFNGMIPNRALYDEDEKVRDVINGPFFICGGKGKHFESLTEEQVERYAEKFRYPEHFTKIGDEIAAIAYGPCKRKESK